MNNRVLNTWTTAYIWKNQGLYYDVTSHSQREIMNWLLITIRFDQHDINLDNIIVLVYDKISAELNNNTKFNPNYFSC